MKAATNPFHPGGAAALPVAPVRSQLFVCCLMKSAGCPTVKAANAAGFDLNIGFSAAAALLKLLKTSAVLSGVPTVPAISALFTPLPTKDKSLWKAVARRLRTFSSHIWNCNIHSILAKGAVFVCAHSQTGSI